MKQEENSSTNSRSFSAIKKLTVITTIMHAFLGAIKILAGIFWHSHGLVADGIHSFSDLITDFMVLFASKYSLEAADASHPYGHKRIETAATLFLALLLIFTGLAIASDAFQHLFQTTQQIASTQALFVELFAIFSNESLFYYTRSEGERLKSTLIIANAWHHRSDVASSIVVAVGILGSLLGFTYLDTIAAIIVGLIIIKMGISYGWSSVKELVDTSVDTEVLTNIEKIINNVPGVKKIHQLRSRLMAGEILIDVHILVEPEISVSEGHFIALQVHYDLLKQLAPIKDVIVHVDPEDDEFQPLSLNLPNRQILQEAFLMPLKKDYPAITAWNLHYLDGFVSIDLICSHTDFQIKYLHERIFSYLILNNNIQQVRLFTQQDVIIRPE